MRFAHSRRCSATARCKSCRGRSKMAGTGTVSVTPTEAPKTVTESARISGGNLVAKALKNEGVEVIFTLCGGHIIDIYDGCLNEGIKIVDVRHEQVAAHAADGYWRVSGKIGWVRCRTCLTST